MANNKVVTETVVDMEGMGIVEITIPAVALIIVEVSPITVVAAAVVGVVADKLTLKNDLLSSVNL